MREILFRGKTLIGRKWLEGDIAHCGIGVFISDPHGNFRRIATTTIGQYTGLTDRNGKKIFEGDILKFGDFIVYVVWNDETFAWECQRADDAHYGYHCDHCQIGKGDWGLIDLGYISSERIITGEMTTEIIGNIHDNPELLKGEKQ